MADFNNNRNTLLLAFILLMLGGVALLEESALVVMILLGLLFLVRQFDNNALATSSTYANNSDSDYYYDDYDDYDEDEVEEENWAELNQQTRQAQNEPVYRHALESVERAGLNPDAVQVLVVDVGMIAYKGGEEKQLYRTWSVPDDVDYVQPFVQLRLPSKAQGSVEFEIVDGAGHTVFKREDTHNLERGRQLIMPKTRLPIHDQREIDGNWQLRVSADGVLLAVHRFEFMESSNSAIRQHIGEDGELNSELRAVMAENRMSKMSLDDLLDYQNEEDETPQERQRRM